MAELNGIVVDLNSALQVFGPEIYKSNYISTHYNLYFESMAFIATH